MGSATKKATAREECASASMDGLAMPASSKPFARFTAAKNVPGTESASLVSASARRGGSVQVARRPKAARTTARVQIMVAVQEPTARACLGGPVLIAHSPPRSNAQKGAMAMVSAK